tara:strand:+ start:348 stop:569 length:222 start_codon:yes stop_codon:yes gene_type:complete
MNIDGKMMDLLLSNSALCRSVESHLSNGKSVEEIAKSVRATAVPRGLRISMATALCFVFTVENVAVENVSAAR